MCFKAFLTNYEVKWDAQLRNKQTQIIDKTIREGCLACLFLQRYNNQYIRCYMSIDLLIVFSLLLIDVNACLERSKQHVDIYFVRF